MRRTTSALATTILGAAITATTVSAQQYLPSAGARRGGTTASASESTPSTGSMPPADASASKADPIFGMAATRGARYLLRNGLDYLSYQEFERALKYFREAEVRQKELNDADRLSLKQGIERAQRGLREAVGSESPYALSRRSRRAGGFAPARPETLAAAAMPRPRNTSAASRTLAREGDDQGQPIRLAGAEEVATTPRRAATADEPVAAQPAPLPEIPRLPQTPNLPDLSDPVTETGRGREGSSPSPVSIAVGGTPEAMLAERAQLQEPLRKPPAGTPHETAEAPPSIPEAAPAPAAELDSAAVAAQADLLSPLPPLDPANVAQAPKADRPAQAVAAREDRDAPAPKPSPRDPAVAPSSAGEAGPAPAPPADAAPPEIQAPEPKPITAAPSSAAEPAQAPPPVAEPVPTLAQAAPAPLTLERPGDAGAAPAPVTEPKSADPDVIPLPPLGNVAEPAKEPARGAAAATAEAPAAPPASEPAQAKAPAATPDAAAEEDEPLPPLPQSTDRGADASPVKGDSRPAPAEPAVADADSEELPPLPGAAAGRESAATEPLPPPADALQPTADALAAPPTAPEASPPAAQAATPEPVAVPVPVPAAAPEAATEPVGTQPAHDTPSQDLAPPAAEPAPALPADPVPAPPAAEPTPEATVEPAAPPAQAGPTPGTMPRAALPGNTTAPRFTGRRSSSSELFTLPRRDTGPSTLQPELQRRVEEIARRQEEEFRRSQAAQPPAVPPGDTRDVGADMRNSTQMNIDISRAPSPAEARPLRAIPVPEDWVPLERRDWTPQSKYWAAAATCHMPLYFQDPMLERYGHSVEHFFGPAGRYMAYPVDDHTQTTQRNQMVQPWFSAGLFAFQIISWPYNLIMDPPWEAQYDLGYWRPGDKIPNDMYYMPLHGTGPPLRGRNY